MPRFLDPFERVREDAHAEALGRLADLEHRASQPHPDFPAFVRTEAAEIRRLIGIKPQEAASRAAPRDTQMRKLYLAENQIPESALLTLAQCEHYLRDVMEDAWFTRLYAQDITLGQVAITIKKKAKTKRISSKTVTVGEGASSTHTIKLHDSMRTKKTLLHELAHAVVNAHWGSHRVAGHGPEFAYTYLRLIYRRFGRQVGHALATSFTDHGVAITPRRASLVQPQEA